MSRGHKTKTSEKGSQKPTKSVPERSASPTASLSLRVEVRDALLAVIRDPQAPASAVASAGRTLMEFFGDEGNESSKPAAEMTLDQINEEIRRAEATTIKQIDVGEQRVGIAALDNAHQ